MAAAIDDAVAAWPPNDRMPVFILGECRGTGEDGVQRGITPSRWCGSSPR